MRYVKIPMDKLDLVRTATRSSLNQLGTVTGKRYALRTFYFGKRSGTNRQYTLKSDATAAKVGIYESKDGYRYHNLIAYV